MEKSNQTSKTQTIINVNIYLILNCCAEIDVI
jgi:hypothetical protein